MDKINLSRDENGYTKDRGNFSKVNSTIQEGKDIKQAVPQA